VQGSQRNLREAVGFIRGTRCKRCLNLEALRPGNVAVIPAGVKAGLGQESAVVIFETPPMSINDERARPRNVRNAHSGRGNPQPVPPHGGSVTAVENRNEAVASDARLSATVMVRHYVDETDEELR
jgi:hypothetical protein